MSAAKFFIPTLPGLPSNSSLSMYGGHIPSAPPKNGIKDSSSDAHLYFFMLRSRHIADKERTILWFNGGPGCSSFDGSFMEAGPLRLIPGKAGELKEVDGGWNEYANVIFIDQPVGTGYSYTDTNEYVHELPEAAQHVVEFLANFYTVFPEFTKHDMYIAGESYAGQYIPYIAKAILEATRLSTRLKGLLIGNGWIDPYNQYPAYLEFALQAGVVKKGSETETKVKKEVEKCQAQLDKVGIESVKIHNGECENILSYITDSTLQDVNGQEMCVNNYDVRLTDTYPACGMNWPPDLLDVTPYLRRADVKTAFHANRKQGSWQECSGQVGTNFWVADSAPAVFLLPKLLEQVSILLFAGDQDLICNHVGIERTIENLTWNGEKGFANATQLDWTVDGKLAGTWTTARNLTYVKIAGASHMAPYDQPIRSHDMLLRFLEIDLLGAAGSAAQVPSKVGDEQEAVIGETHPNGTAVVAGINPNNLDLTGSSANSGKLLDTDNSDLLTALVNVGSAVVIVVILLFGLGVWWAIRRRANRGKGSILSETELGASRTHSRKRSSLGRGRAIQEDEDRHELDELVRNGDTTEEIEDDFNNWSGSSQEKGKNATRLREQEEIFGIGDADER